MTKKIKVFSLAKFIKRVMEKLEKQEKKLDPNLDYFSWLVPYDGFEAIPLDSKGIIYLVNGLPVLALDLIEIEIEL